MVDGFMAEVRKGCAKDRHHHRLDQRHFGIAHSLAAAGMNVILSGFGAAADINKMRDELAKRYKDSVAYSATGMSKPEQIVRMVEDASRIFGQIDILVNNAGILHTGPVSAEEALGHILGQVQPTRQYVTIDQIGALVSLLCADRAASIAGATFCIDGGWTAA